MQREERFRLFKEPETEAPGLLDDVRRHLRAVTNPGLRLGSASVRAVFPMRRADFLCGAPVARPTRRRFGHLA
jgi:hypothetical protein